MIPLRIPIEPLPIEVPLVTRLRVNREPPNSEYDAYLISTDGGVAEFDLAGISLRVHYSDAYALDGDVIMVLPGQKAIDRLIRASSDHNTFLVTEQCDQLCVMCSQPPKKHHVDLFVQFEQAAILAPQNAWIGISGGEPLLHKSRLFDLIKNVLSRRPDLHFHVLTNAQHFDSNDIAVLSSGHFRNVLWGIPIYSADPQNHDDIVGKRGAFRHLTYSLSLLARAAANIELRTVALNSNRDDISGLAKFICVNIPFAETWAIMQLENIGYGRMNWSNEFWDTSAEFGQLANALDITGAHGVEVCLYNFPLCSIPEPYRRLNRQSISDWKQKYLTLCDNCAIKDSCGGFFAWYPANNGFAHLGGYEKENVSNSVATCGRVAAQQG